MKASDLEEKIRLHREVTTLQAGEILIAVATNVGWTPYFGLLTLDRNAGTPKLTTEDEVESAEGL